MATSTHSLSGIFTHNGKNFRVPSTIKITVKPDQTVDEAVKALILAKYPGADCSGVRATAIKPKAKKISVNPQHEYITLTAQYADGTIRFTVSWRGCKLSGDIGADTDGKALLQRIDKLGKDKAPVDHIESLRAMAEKSNNKAEFIAAIHA